MTVRHFRDIFEHEVAAISHRRSELKRGRPSIELETEKAQDPVVMRPTSASKVVGLALSGGGIRSAAFCLGAMQALQEQDRLFEKIDYMSTVSGGGYIGTSMTAAMNKTGKFPFTSELQQRELPGVQHIRDHSNYLFPQGALNIFANIVVYLRGLAANVLIILPWLMLMAAFTLHSNPDRASLADPNVWHFHIPVLVKGVNFGITLTLLIIFFGALILWGLWRSCRWGRNRADLGYGSTGFGWWLVAILVFAFLELQPLLITGMFKVQQDGIAKTFGGATDWLKTVGATFAAIGAATGFLGRYLADALKRASESSGLIPFATRIAIKLAMYVAGAAVPLVLWLVYLYLAFWGIQDCTAYVDCAAHAPSWLTKLVAATPFMGGSIGRFYLCAGLIGVLVSVLLLKPNATSLHRLYRDRLSKTFLFDPDHLVESNGLLAWLHLAKKHKRAPRMSDLAPADDLKLSKLNTDRAPYHLINTALNIEASKYANRRGRNAEFFIFSPLFTGSEATGYVDTAKMEANMKGLTVGTAMAVSGAAASANMGSATIKPLTPTLAILNIRLGYWITNPAAIGDRHTINATFAWLFDKFYFANEMLGRLNEQSNLVYLTDGGHIENLGLYELLRRRCKLIIAVDGEADPDMAFTALVTLERYARIDFGLRIGLPWASLRDATKAGSEQVKKTGGQPPTEAANGPHCALGTIYYPRNEAIGEADQNSTGLLLYVKASFTGDENDYIVDYKRRNEDFPHETTIDQLFTEEQFEVYRALGFHAVNSAFTGADLVSMGGKPEKWKLRKATHPLERRLREILDLPLDPPPPPPVSVTDT